MLSEETQNILARILLALAEGERSVEDARKEIANEDNYDIQTIFKVLDSNGDNFITPKDLQNYLINHGLDVNFKEVKLLILFYDQDHDFALTFGEIFKVIHPDKEFPNNPKYIRDEEINIRVDEKLYNLLEKEILMARNILSLLDEIKHKRDFNIHSAFHALKYYACITGDSINLFLKNCGMEPTAGDVRAILKRLDINKDEIVDFCEFHAFLGYPDCTFCCPCFPCPNCGIKYCEDCLNDIPCYLLGCDHKGMDSKMRCTSIEHNPNIDQMNSFISSRNRNQNSFYNNINMSSRVRQEEEENEKNQNNDLIKSKFPLGIKKGFHNNISPEQFNLLQGLTNPEQLNKFMTLNGILDRQNSDEINITKNLSLRLAPLRDFDPSNWGCKNCPCNIHANPNVPCDCCACNICPNRDNYNDDIRKEKIKQKKFPKINLYSYTYTYEPETNNNDDIFNPIRSMNDKNKGNINSPYGKNSPYYNKSANKFGKTMANSSDDEKDFDNYTNNRNKNNYNNNYSPNNMIYNDEMNNNNFNNHRSIENEEENINDINNNENNYNIRKINKNEENIINEKNKNRIKNRIQNDDNNEEGENEIQEQNAQDENNRINNNDNNMDNNYNTYSPNNDNNAQNPFNRNNNIRDNNNSNIPDNVMYRTSPEGFNIGMNKNLLEDSLGFKMAKTINLNVNKNKNQNSKLVQEEESEDDLYSSKKNGFYKSQKEIIDEEEQKFLIYLKALIKSEREIEFARRDLMRQKDFNGEDAFRLFEIKGTGVVTIQDLIFGLKLLGVKHNPKQIKLIMNVYDLDGNGVLNYSDFFDMVIAYKDEDRKEEERRRANRNIGNRDINIFSLLTRELYKKLFLVIIEEEERLEELKLKLEINDDLIKGIFNRISLDGDFICDKYEFVNYCLRNKVCKEKKDAYLAFIRLNRKRDGGLDIKDISVGVKSSVIGK